MKKIITKKIIMEKTAMKKMKKIVKINSLISLILMVLVCSVSVVFAQGNDNDFQQLLSRIQPVLNKNVENMTKDDLTILNDVIYLSPNAFGEVNSRLCINLINQAKTKKREYDDFIDSKKKLARTIDERDRETALREQAEEKRDELIAENTDLKTLIETLQARITNFEKQMHKLTQANKKLQAENIVAKELLQTSSDLVAQMLMLMPRLSIDNATMDELPQTLKDSLVDAQCGVAKLLKENFVVTIQQLEANQQFMDSSVAFFQTNRRHSADITIYIDNGNELIRRLRNSGIDCAIGYASDIENEMNGFLMKIESRQLVPGENLFDFIMDNLIWLIPLLVILILGIVLVARKTSSTDDDKK